MTDVIELRAQLNKEKEWLIAELERLNIESRQQDANREGSPFGKREEGGTEATELERKLAQENKLTEHLAEVNHALEKFEKGTFGTCERCGRPIEMARLEAIQWANLCLTCKSTKDKKNRLAR
jgi:DnaK suppressor protein